MWPLHSKFESAFETIKKFRNRFVAVAANVQAHEHLFEPLLDIICECEFILREKDIKLPKNRLPFGCGALSPADSAQPTCDAHRALHANGYCTEIAPGRRQKKRYGTSLLSLVLGTFVKERVKCIGMITGKDHSAIFGTLLGTSAFVAET